MRALVQRVTQAQVSIDGKEQASIENGMLILLSVSQEDSRPDADTLWKKVRDLRIFDDENGTPNLALADVDGQVLVVSQFTLYASVRKGRRPSYSRAASGQQAEELYRYFCDLARRDIPVVKTGVFGACMQVGLVNDGPFTIWVDTEELA